MVRLEGETSNTVFEILEEWNNYLKAENIDVSREVKARPLPLRQGPSL